MNVSESQTLSRICSFHHQMELKTHFFAFSEGWVVLSAEATPSTGSNLSVVWGKDRMSALTSFRPFFGPTKSSAEGRWPAATWCPHQLLQALVYWGGPCTSQHEDDGSLLPSPCLTQSWLVSYCLALPHSREVVTLPQVIWLLVLLLIPRPDLSSHKPAPTPESFPDLTA